MDIIKAFFDFINWFRTRREIMAAIDDLKSAVTDLQNKNNTVVSKINGLTQIVTDLQVAITALETVNPELVALTQLIKDEIAKLNTVAP